MIVPGMVMIDSPIFLVGAERSGTTLLRLMLDHHPQVAFHSEFEFAVDRINETEGIRIAYPALDDYYEYLRYNRIFLDSGFSIDRSLTYPELVNDFLLQKKRRAQKPIAGATLHHHFQYLHHIWPNAKYIHILRDGRDVASSVVQMGWSGNLFKGAEMWITAETTWENLSVQLPPEQHLTVVFEKLVGHPEKVLNKICQFIGVPFDNKMFDYVNNSAYSLPDPNAIRRWKNFKPFDIQLCESRIASMLLTRGYNLSGLPRLKNTKFLNWKMTLHDRIFKIKFNIKRYSFGLWIIDLFIRRLHLNIGREKIFRAKAEIERMHLK